MRLILYAGVAALTATAAFAFARAVDHMTRAPVATAPVAIRTERLQPGPQPAPVPVQPMQEPRQGPAIAQMPQVAARPATPAAQHGPDIRRQALNTTAVAEADVSFDAFDENAMLFVPHDSPVTLDTDEPAGRYDFMNMPMTGVYR